MCLHIIWKVHAACDLTFVVNNEDFSGHWKSGNILETVLDRNVETTRH